jgi:TolB-like protein
MSELLAGVWGMANFFAELKRRQMFRVAAAYAVVAWLLLQLVNNVAPALRLPEWAATFIVVLLVIGFPVALLFCWIHQLTPADGASPPAKTAKLDWLLIGALVLVIALVSYQQFAPSGTTAAQQQAGVATASSPSQPGGIAIAVLPLANLSGDAAQEFFSDGMTDEITLALAKIRDLRVVGRSSAFQFKGQNRDLRAIGQALAARYLIDGSVRKEGNRLRITAQLIEAGNGVNVWTESYDRELTSVFAIQADIAQAIAGALQVPLGLRQGETLVSNRTDDLESYDRYLRAKALVRARGLRSLTDAAALLEEAVARDPGFAPAWALLALAHVLTPNYHPGMFTGVVEDYRRIVDASLPKAEAAAQQAIRLDPNFGDGYVALAAVQSNRGRIVLAEELYSKALTLNPNNPDALHFYSALLSMVGRQKDAIAMRQRLQVLEPFVPIFNWATAWMLWLDGQEDSAITILRNAPTAIGYPFLPTIHAAAGRYGEAADLLLTIPPGLYPPGMVEEAARLLRTAPATTASPETLPRLWFLGFVYHYIGASSRVLEFSEGSVEAGYNVLIVITPLWHPSYASVRKMERFKTLVRNAGLVDYWRARGWPDLCRPVGTDDFVCD